MRCSTPDPVDQLQALHAEGAQHASAVRRLVKKTHSALHHHQTRCVCAATCSCQHCYHPSTGAGAAAAANDAAGYFRFELLRRIVLEFGMPWASLLLAQRRRARSKGGARNNASSSASDSSTLAGESSGRAAEFPAASEGVVAGRSAGSGGGGAGAVAVSGLSGLQQTVGVDDAAKPAFDAFTGCWDVTRDMG